MNTNLRRKAAKTAMIFALGLAAFAGGALVVNAATTAQQSASKKKRGAAKASFQIKAKVTRQLQPGAQVPIKVSLANNRSFPLWIKKLSVVLAVDKAHAAAGCSVARDYRVEQLPAKFFPYKLEKKRKAKKTKSKKKVKVQWKPLRTSRRQGKPTMSMVALADVNQDACKGATLTIAFKSQATKKRPRTKKAAK